MRHISEAGGTFHERFVKDVILLGFTAGSLAVPTILYLRRSESAKQDTRKEDVVFDPSEHDFGEAGVVLDVDQNATLPIKT